MDRMAKHTFFALKELYAAGCENLQENIYVVCHAGPHRYGREYPGAVCPEDPAGDTGTVLYSLL